MPLVSLGLLSCRLCFGLFCGLLCGQFSSCSYYLSLGWRFSLCEYVRHILNVFPRYWLLCPLRPVIWLLGKSLFCLVMCHLVLLHHQLNNGLTSVRFCFLILMSLFLITYETFATHVSNRITMADYPNWIAIFVFEQGLPLCFTIYCFSGSSWLDHTTQRSRDPCMHSHNKMDCFRDVRYESRLRRSNLFGHRINMCSRAIWCRFRCGLGNQLCAGSNWLSPANLLPVCQ